MAGVKGRSGGARPGAGRKPRPPATTVAAAPVAAKPTEPGPEEEPEAAEPVPSDAREFLRKVMRGQVVPSVPQLEAAKLLARLEVTPVGKKGAQQAAANNVAGKFGARPAPLKLVNGK